MGLAKSNHEFHNNKLVQNHAVFEGLKLKRQRTIPLLIIILR